MNVIRIIALVVVVLLLVITIPSAINMALLVATAGDVTSARLGALLGSLIPVLVFGAVAQRLFRRIRSAKE